ncbi:MAG: formylglycine-generating enzyme family protein, partial [bacterium]
DGAAQPATAGRLAVVEAREDHPVVGVTWYGAIAFAAYYSVLTGASPVYDLDVGSWDTDRAGYRLPTEAEWEYAATAGGDSAYPWGQSLSPARANYFRSGDPFEAVTPPYTARGGPTTPVAYYDGTSQDGYETLPNSAPSGQYDLIGNVWEWCFDWYASGFGVAAEEIPEDGTMLMDPTGPEEGEPDAFGVLQRVVRGTGWNTRVDSVLTRKRGRFDPGEGSYATGFRLVLDLPAPAAATASAPPPEGESAPASGR